MFRPVRMCRIECVTVPERKESLVGALRSEGVVQVDYVREDFLEENSLSRDRPAEHAEQVSTLLHRVNSLIELLGAFHSPSTNFLEDILNVDKTPKTRVDDLHEKIIEDASFLTGSIEDDVHSYSKSVTQLESMVGELDARVVEYSIYRDFDFHMKYSGPSRFLYVTAGSIPSDFRERLESRLQDAFGKEYLSAYGEADDKMPAAFCVLENHEGDLNEILSQCRFEPVKEVLGEGYLSRLSDMMSIEVESFRKALEESRKRLRALYEENYQLLIVYKELLEIEKKRCEVYSSMASTGKLVYASLWTPRKHCQRILDVIDESTQGLNSVEVDWKPEDAPVLLDNPPVIRSFELLTRLFSSPRYNEVDPTPFIAPTFMLFSGIMLGDVPYGIFMLFASLLLYRMYGKYSQSLKDFSTITAMVGFSTVFGGVLTGSYFGNFYSEYVLGTTSESIALLFDPMLGENMILVLAITCAIGILHIFTGFTLGFCESVINGNYRTAVLKYMSWFLIMAAGIALAATAYPAEAHTLSPSYATPALIAAALGFAALFVHEGPIGFYLQVSGFLGNTLSYARIMALLLTTGVMAFTINLIAYMAYQIPVAGVVLASCIFILGHLTNILMNAMGAFVHTLRLHYVEFFNAFYTGGGEEFKPLKDERIYTYTT
ncbi:MAG: V-type ATP synthase subunit I [Candidatus Altiarchaeota archaeon]